MLALESTKNTSRNNSQSKYEMYDQKSEKLITPGKRKRSKLKSPKKSNSPKKTPK